MNEKHKGILWVVGIVLAVVFLRASCESDSDSDIGWRPPGSCVRCHGSCYEPCGFCTNGWVTTTYNDGYQCGVCHGTGRTRCGFCGGSGR
jgi:hypothetical protein